ncbi:DEAD/DEAH box helicase [Moorella naiadis]|uniref:DEAD/DEAH box helicase n=1 Tax=Moorella naiadis (nom. illeg.) TaxID=3093670 RepID=UPI003D9CB886
MSKVSAKYRWDDGRRISTEDGSHLLKTPEAAKILGVPVSFIRELVHKDMLTIKATYTINSYENKGWLISEKEVKALYDDPLVAEKRESYKHWLKLRQNSREKAELPLPKAKVRPLKKKRIIKPDAFQEKAVDLAMQGLDVLVIAPTGAGKTWIAEQLARRAVQEGKKFVYASPLKSLSNQRYHDFAALFGEERAGIITGDVTINPGVDVITMTTEIFRNKCVCSPYELLQVKWAVIDEFHLLDSDRGSAWEESVIFAPPGVSLLYLSATVSNYREIASWIEWARGKNVEVVISERRPVPLVWRWFIDGKVLTEKTAPAKIRLLKEAKEERYWSRRSYGGWREWNDFDDWDDDWEDWEDD